MVGSPRYHRACDRIPLAVESGQHLPRPGCTTHTLVDTGPNLPSALEQLEAGLAGLGFRVEDLERIVLTHPHIDHVGLAEVVRRRSGAEVWGPAGAERWLTTFRESDHWIRSWREGLMRRHGVPSEVVARRSRETTFDAGWDPSVRLDHLMHDGVTVPFRDRRWRVALRPGHSPFDLLFHDERNRSVLVGDHLIDHISSNALITPIPMVTPETRPSPLLDYRRSLARTTEMSADVFLSGHGSPITDAGRLIDGRLAAMDRRARRIQELVGAARLSAHAVAREIWGETAESEAWLTISEVLGHVDLLSERGLVTEIETDEGVLLECREPAGSTVVTYAFLHRRHRAAVGCHECTRAVVGSRIDG